MFIQQIRYLTLPLSVLACLLTVTLLSQEQPIQWDPDTVWDGPNPAEPVALFLAGILVAAPISLLIIRSRRRAKRQIQSIDIDVFRS